MHSFREAAGFYGRTPEKIHLELKRTTLDWQQRLAKYFPFREVGGIDAALAAVRMVKSEYELTQMKISGRIHAEVLDEVVPSLVREGISEAELAVAIYREMLIRGSHGTARFRSSALLASARAVWYRRRLTGRAALTAPALRCRISAVPSASCGRTS